MEETKKAATFYADVGLRERLLTNFDKYYLAF